MSTEFVSMNFMAFHAEFSVEFLMEPKISPPIRGACVSIAYLLMCVCNLPTPNFGV